MILCDDKNFLNKKLFLLSEAIHDRFFTFKLIRILPKCFYFYNKPDHQSNWESSASDMFFDD